MIAAREPAQYREPVCPVDRMAGQPPGHSASYSRNRSPGFTDHLTDCQPLDVETIAALVAHMQAGDIAARQALVQSQTRWVLVLVQQAGRRYRLSADEVDEMLSMCLLRLAKFIGKYDASRGKLSTFTASIVKYTLRLHWYKKRTTPDAVDLAFSLDAKRNAGSQSFGETLADLTTPDATAAVDQRIDRQTERERLHAVIDRLPAREAETVRRYLAGDEMCDVADTMGICRARVGQLRKRAVVRLRGMLGKGR